VRGQGQHRHREQQEERHRERIEAEERGEQRVGARAADDRARDLLGHAPRERHAEHQHESVPGRHEHRHVAQAVGVQAPDQRQEQLARGGDRDAGEVAAALGRGHRREQRERERPDHGADGELPRQLDLDVSPQAEREDRDGREQQRGPHAS